MGGSWNFPAMEYAVRETLMQAKRKLMESIMSAKKKEALKNGKGKDTHV